MTGVRTAAGAVERREGQRNPLVEGASLDTVAMRLAHEYPQLGAGSVLRCLLRAAHGLRAAGVSYTVMPVEAERLTRGLLERRVGRL